MGEIVSINEKRMPIATLSGSIEFESDAQKEAVHEFIVPDHIRVLQLRVLMKTEPNRLAFHVHDPVRDRGCFIPWFPDQLGDEFNLIIARDEATRGLLRGPIPSGAWTLQMTGYRFIESMSYTIEVSGIASDTAQFQWYAGDLHTHSNHSDGIYSVGEMVRFAKESGLQFLCLTDHNTISALDEWDADVASRADDRFLVLKGMEYTTTRGHANAFGLHTPIDWHADGRKRTFSHIAAETKAQGALFSINHPFSTNSSSNWAEWDMDLAQVDSLEVWNHLQMIKRCGGEEKALAKWNELLNEGYRITGLGGSDAVHRHPSSEHRIGMPTTYVWMERLTRDDLLNGIKEGRVVVSEGPLLQTTLTYNNRVYMIGDRISVEGETYVDLQIDWAVKEDSTIQLVQNGELAAQFDSQPSRPIKAKVRSGDWLRIQVRDKEHKRLRAFANPYYFI